nr:unnamed protein product [Digitaria exilis]
MDCSIERTTTKRRRRRSGTAKGRHAATKLLLRRLIHSNAALRHVNPATATVSLPALLIGAVIIFSLLADRRAPFLNANLSTSSLASPSLPRPPARGGHPLSSAGFPRAATSSGATSGSPPTTTPGRTTPTGAAR